MFYHNEAKLPRKRIGSSLKLLKVNIVDIPKTYNNYIDEKVAEDQSIWMQNFGNYFSEYCSASGIHGIRYLGERGRFMIEKVTWFIVIGFVCYFCTTSIMKAYNKWVTSPVIVTFATKESAIFEIPFPAVTICPEIKSNPEVFNFTEVLLSKVFNEHVTSEQNRYYESFSLICTGLDDKDYPGAERIHHDNLTVGSHTMQDMIDAFPNMATNTSFVWWIGDVTEFDWAMSKTFTSEGLCYSFNMLNVEDILVNPGEHASKCSVEHTKTKQWTLEEGYPTGERLETFPLRTFVSGINGGFELDIFTNHSHMDYLCRDSLQGFKVTLHHPSELPNMDRHFRLPLDQAVLVSVKPRMIKVARELKGYKAEDRQCYFAKEKHLIFYKSYTQQNCLAECLSNYTFAQCGCAAFYMPKLISTPICGPGSKECMKTSKINYLVDEVESVANGSTANNPGCHCLPACTSLEYDIEISQTDWNWQDSFKAFERKTGLKEADFDYTLAHISKLAVYYREMQFLSSERQELYGSLDFFSNIGGLLGLFIGFSVTSAVEILYFLSLRLVCNIHKFGGRFWSGQT